MVDIKLLEPELDLDYKLMKSINNRRTKRKLENENLSLQTLSNILWVACGETKQATKRSKNRRTIPSACNSQKVCIYVCLEEGVFKYIESTHYLKYIEAIDIREKIVKQKFLKNMAVGLIYVATYDGVSGIIKHDISMENLLIGVEVGCMTQDIYLYCSQEKINTVLVGLYNKDAFSIYLKLKENEKIVFTQVLG